MNEEILKAVDEIADEMIEGIKRIVRIDSVESEAVNDAPFGEGVRHALDETLQLSRDLGFETVDVDHYIGYARYGKSDDYVCACGHLDVVPVGEADKRPNAGCSALTNSVFSWLSSSSRVYSFSTLPQTFV